MTTPASFLTWQPSTSLGEEAQRRMFALLMREGLSSADPLEQDMLPLLYGLIDQAVTPALRDSVVAEVLTCAFTSSVYANTDDRNAAALECLRYIETCGWRFAAPDPVSYKDTVLVLFHYPESYAERVHDTLPDFIGCLTRMGLPWHAATMDYPPLFLLERNGITTATRLLHAFHVNNILLTPHHGPHTLFESLSSFLFKHCSEKPCPVLSEVEQFGAVLAPYLAAHEEKDLLSHAIACMNTYKQTRSMEGMATCLLTHFSRQNEKLLLEETLPQVPSHTSLTCPHQGAPQRRTRL